MEFFNIDIFIMTTTHILSLKVGLLPDPEFRGFPDIFLPVPRSVYTPKILSPKNPRRGVPGNLVPENSPLGSPRNFFLPDLSPNEKKIQKYEKKYVFKYF